MNTKQQARFWTWHKGGPVLLKLKPGQTLHHYSTWWNGEGKSFEAHIWEYDGETVTQRHETGGRDCDGSHGYSDAFQCSVDNLQAGEHDAEFSVNWPIWERERPARVFDLFAEQAGY